MAEPSAPSGAGSHAARAVPSSTDGAARPHDDGGPHPVRAVALAVGLTLALLVLVQVFLVRMFHVPSASMEPTLQPVDRVRVDAAAAGRQGLRHGDVVVFDGAGSLAPYRSAGSLERGLEDVARWWGVGAAEDVFVKRVLALPGDRLECCAPDGRLLREGEPLDEPYLGRPVTADEPAAAGTWSFEVPDGRMVVLGDHRAASRDSRALLGAPGGGLIPLERVEGRAAEIVWPLSRRGTMDAPSGDTP